MAYDIENPCERLVLVRLLPPITANEAVTFKGDLAKTLESVKGGGLVCTDLRQTDLFPPHVMNQYVDIMRRVNSLIQRSVFWTSNDGMHSGQIERMVREGNNPSRRALQQVGDIEAWLGEIATQREKNGLHRFLKTTVGVARRA